LLGNRRIDSRMKVIKVVGNKIGQVGVLRVVPALFNGIQFGTIRRQGLEREPSGMVVLEVCRRRLMHVPAIPYQNHVATIVAVHEPEQPDHVERVHVLRPELEVER